MVPVYERGAAFVIMNYYERHIGDYLKDTAHLSLLEHGVYTRLLDVYYTRESAIPNDQTARLVGARSKEEKEALDVVLNEFFVLTENGWEQDRCNREIARYQDKQAKAKNSAAVRWNAQRPQYERNTNAIRTHCEGNAPNHQSPNTKQKIKTLAPDGAFERFWSAYPKRKSRGTALKAWNKLQPDEQLQDRIMRALERAKTSADWQKEGGKFIPYPASWLNAQGWEDEIGERREASMFEGAI